ncbi:MAG TPA: virulence factor SrfC family protein, partial [Rhodopila sp.]|nr:virulence factor SrfC family protein [Rhodopila sp.]
VGPSNQDVQTLPEMIDGWIRDTIGATPESRAGQRNALFLVLTKFDMEFVDKGPEDVASGQRWTTRLQASLLDFFGKAYDWPKQWAPNKPFDNCFWLRSTSIGFPALFDYRDGATADGPRTELWADRADAFIAPRHTAYATNASVQAHFADPERAWIEALRPNDGGISYLAECLRPVCDPSLKAEQITGRLSELTRDIAAQLRPYYHTGDIAAELAKVRQAAQGLQRALVACARIQMFGPLLRSLMVSQDQMSSVYWRLQLQPDEHVLPTGAIAHDPWAQFDIPSDGDQQAAQDSFDRLAEMAIDQWTRTCQDVADDPTTETLFRLPREQAVLLAGALTRASRRLKLRERIANSLRTRASFQQHSATAAQKPILIMEHEINQFVYMLGFDWLAPEKRPEQLNRSQRIFAPRSPVSGLPPLGPTQTPFDFTFQADWITAIARTLEDNVHDVSSGTLDIKANEKLGDVLHRLGA